MWNELHPSDRAAHQIADAKRFSRTAVLLSVTPTQLQPRSAGATLLLLNAVLGPKRPSVVKGDAFECGNPPTGSARDRFAVKFYLVAILFLIFDVEAVFIYPWAVVLSDSLKGANSLSGDLVLLEMVVFVAVIVVGLAYAWRKGAVELGLVAHVADDEAVEPAAERHLHIHRWVSSSSTRRSC